MACKTEYGESPGVGVVLHTAASNFQPTYFGHAVDGLGSLTADAPLSDAAAAVPSLQTGVACRAVQSQLAVEATAVCDGARQFSENLRAAARWYENHDKAAANAIEKIETT